MAKSLTKMDIPSNEEILNLFPIIKSKLEHYCRYQNEDFDEFGVIGLQESQRYDLCFEYYKLSRIYNKETVSEKVYRLLQHYLIANK
jgi:hypothetical protein